MTSFLDANEYWLQSERLESQRLYVQFTLFCSAITDFCVGLELKDQSKLNWAASAFYYSMVHSGRFLIFSFAGDFPTGHKQLIDFINSTSRIKCNWLDKFINKSHDPFLSNVNYQTHHLIDKKYSGFITADSIVEFYRNIGLIKFKDDFEKFGKIMKQSKLLREDSNYESLLIAHEYDHEYVSPCFEELVRYLLKSCEFIIKLIGNVYYQYMIKYHHHFLTQINVRNFIDYYIGKRIMRQLNSRFSQQTRNKIIDVLGENLQTSPVNIESITNIEESISFDLFNTKSELMREFNSKINELRSVINE